MLEVAVTDGFQGATLNETVAANLAPTNVVSVLAANANGPYTVQVDMPVTLSAAGSSGGSMGVLQLQWAVTENPPNLDELPILQLSGENTESPVFQTDTPGTYRVALIVRPSTLFALVDVDITTIEVTPA